MQLLEAPDSRIALRTSITWWDDDTNCTLVVARPSDVPRLWQEYLAGAVRSYRKHGVECALDMDALLTGSDTALFFAAIDSGGQVAGGVRAKGPLRSAEDSHAVVEWEGNPGQAAVRKMINDRVPFGILEMKSAWVADGHPSSRALTKAIARSGFHAMALMNIQFCMATAGQYILDRWKSSGGVVADHIPPTPYPDDRYQTAMMWWDRQTFIKYAEPQQVSKIFQEMSALRRRAYHADSAPGGDGALADLLTVAAEKEPA
jgi:hypothetical protein